jgi:hypothetical protein
MASKTGARESSKSAPSRSSLRHTCPASRGGVRIGAADGHVAHTALDPDI